MSDNNITKLIVDLGSTQIYEDDIQRAIDNACIDLGIEDLKKEGQRPWKAVMTYVGKHLFPDTNVLKDRRLYSVDDNSIPSNFNRYDRDVINILCDEYIYISNKYNKLVSTIAFSNMLNIPTTTLDLWAGDEPSSTSFKVWKKLQTSRKDCITDRAYDSNSPVGTMFVGNNEFGMNQPGIGDAATQRKELTANDVRALLAQKNGSELHQIGTQLNENNQENAP